jgi:hypothetical protein
MIEQAYSGVLKLRPAVLARGLDIFGIVSVKPSVSELNMAGASSARVVAFVEKTV